MAQQDNTLDWQGILGTALGTYADIKVAESEAEMAQAEAASRNEPRAERVVDYNAAGQEDLSGPGSLGPVRGTLREVPTWAWVAIGGLLILWSGIRLER